MPNPTLFADNFLIITGEGTWYNAPLIPEINNSTTKIKYDDAYPNKLITTAVIVGAIIINIFKLILSANNPINGFASDGNVRITNSKLAIE